MLAEALPFIGHVSIRNRGTIGGTSRTPTRRRSCPRSLSSRAPRWSCAPVQGERIVPADDFFVGHFTTSMADDELLTEVRFPSGPAGAGWAFHEIVRRHGDFALVGVAAMLTIADGRVGEARIGLMGVADRAVRAPTRRRHSSASPPMPARSTPPPTKRSGVGAGSDIHGSAEFRRHLAGVVTAMR